MVNENLLICSSCFLLSIITVFGHFSEKLVPQVSNVRCGYDADCKEDNSYCKGNDAAAGIQGLCACKEDTFIDITAKQYKCLRFGIDWGSDCQIDRQCHLALGNYGYCDSKGKCVCQENAHYFESTCYKTVKMGSEEACQTDAECKLRVVGSSNRPHGHCVNGVCRCGLNEHLTPEGACVRSARIGEDCQRDENCHNTVTALCRVKCVCRQGYVVTDDGRDCLKAAVEVNDNCTQLSQCTEYLGEASHCHQSRCECVAGSHVYGTRCYRTRHLADNCRHRNECLGHAANSPATVECASQQQGGGVCACRPGNRQAGQVCVATGAAADGDDTTSGGDDHRRSGTVTAPQTLHTVLGVAIMLFVFCVN